MKRAGILGHLGIFSYLLRACTYMSIARGNQSTFQRFFKEGRAGKDKNKNNLHLKVPC